MIALDIGGTKIKYGIFSECAEEFGQFDVCNVDGEECVAKSIVEFLGSHRVGTVGISVPGPFDFETGTSHMKHKLTSLYGVGLKKMLTERFPNLDVYFIHDAHAFALGVMEENKNLSDKNFSCLMLGTGIGYINVEKGNPKLNEAGTPQNPLWNMPFKSGIAEDYVSSKALIKSAKEKGCDFDNIKDMADSARNGNSQMLQIFEHFGELLGECAEIKRKEHCFTSVVIGGQISKSFDLMMPGFRRVSDLTVYRVKNPEKCALFGLKRFGENRA